MPVRNTLGLAREMGTVMTVAEPGRIRQAQAETEGCGRGVSRAGQQSGTASYGQPSLLASTPE